MNTALRSLLALTLVLFTCALVAADGERHVVGEVQACSASSITVVLDSKKTETITVNDQTVVRRGRDTISMLDIEVGELAMVFAKKIGGSEVATSVTVKPKP